MFCSHCGKKLEANESYCDTCGLTTPKAPENKGPPKYTFPMWIIGLMCIGLFGLLGVIASLYLQDNVSTPIQSQISLLQDQKISEAYYGYTSKDFQKTTSLDDFKSFLKKNPIFLSAKKVKINDESIFNPMMKVNSTIIGKDNRSYSVEYRLIKEGDGWRISSIELNEKGEGASRPHASRRQGSFSNSAVIAMADPIKESGEKGAYDDALASAIEKQMYALRQKKIASAYGGMAEGFKGTVKLSEFSDFLNAHPIFFNYASFKFEIENKSPPFATVTVHVKDNRDITSTFSYTLHYENKSWKILAIDEKKDLTAAADLKAPESHLSKEKKDAPKEKKEFDSEPINAYVLSMLEAIKAGKLENAYKDFTTEKFRDATSFADFENFVKEHSSLTKFEKMEFLRFSLKGSFIYISGRLVVSEAATYPIDFTLADQNGEWRVEYIQIHAIQNPFGENRPLQFTEMTLGTKVDGKGKIVVGSPPWASDSGEIYLTIAYQGGAEGDAVTVTIRHEESNSEMPPVAAGVMRSDSYLTFAFTPPKNGWPKGTYLIDVFSSNGAKKELRAVVN